MVIGQSQITRQDHTGTLRFHNIIDRARTDASEYKLKKCEWPGEHLWNGEKVAAVATFMPLCMWPSASSRFCCPLGPSTTYRLSAKYMHSIKVPSLYSTKASRCMVTLLHLCCTLQFMKPPNEPYAACAVVIMTCIRSSKEGWLPQVVSSA